MNGTCPGCTAAWDACACDIDVLLAIAHAADPDPYPDPDAGPARMRPVLLPGVNPARSQRAIPYKRPRIWPPGVSRAISDQTALAAVADAAARRGGPGGLTRARYDRTRDRTVSLSSARLIQRFGSWKAVCAAAGCRPGVRLGNGQGRTQSFTDDRLLELATAYLTGANTPTYRGFTDWLLGQDGAPSAQTFRNRFGGWSGVKNAVHGTTSPYPASPGRTVVGPLRERAS